MALALDVYRVTKAFPKEETFGLTSQMRRAAASVPANLAEGSARKGDQETRQFYYIARGSLSELETFLTLSLGLAYLSEEAYSDLMKTSGRVSALLNGLIRD